MRHGSFGRGLATKKWLAPAHRAIRGAIRAPRPGTQPPLRGGSWLLDGTFGEGYYDRLGLDSKSQLGGEEDHGAVACSQDEEYFRNVEPAARGPQKESGQHGWGLAGS